MLFVANTTSQSFAGMVGNCSYVFAFTAERANLYSKMYWNATIGEMLDSFIFGILANSLKYRNIMLMNKYYEETKNRPA